MGLQLKGYEKAGRVFKLVGWVIIILTVLFAIAAFPSFQRTHKIGTLVSSLPVVLIFNGFLIFLGKSICQHKDWARGVGIMVGTLQLLMFPIGTQIGAYVLYHLIKGWNDAS